MIPRIDLTGSPPTEPVKIESLSVSELANMLALSDCDLDNGAALKLEDLQNRAQSMDGAKLEDGQSISLSSAMTIKKAIINKPGYCFRFQRSKSCRLTSSLSCTYR